MGKTIKMKAEKPAEPATYTPDWVRLFIAARALLAAARYCRPGDERIFCKWCGNHVDEGGLYGHETHCPLTSLAAAWDGIARRVTVGLLSQNWPPGFEFLEDNELDGETGQEETRQDAPGRAAGPGVSSRYQETPGAPGGPVEAVRGASGRKGPARVTTERLYAGPAAGFAVADEDGEAEFADFGEPWQFDAHMVRNRAVNAVAAANDGEYARRIVAAVNLAAGAPTDALERAFEEISSSTPQWALLAVDISNLHAGHMATIRDFIDATVKRAAAPVAIDQEAAGGGRVQ